MRFPTSWRGTGGIEAQPGGYSMPVAEPLAPGQYVTFPGDYGAPARNMGFSTPPTGAAWNPGAVGASDSYADWMRRTKWWNKYLAAAGAAAAAYELYDQFQHRAPGAWGAPEWGMMIAPGWTISCQSLNGMPLWGPYAAYGGPPPSGACGTTATGFVPGVTWYDALPAGYNPGGAPKGLFDPGNGNYTCGYVRQVTPSPLSSPNIYFWGLYAEVLGVDPPAGGHPERAGAPLMYAPVPNPLEKPSASVSGLSAPVPRSIADRAGQFAPRVQPVQEPRPGPVRRPPGVPPGVDLGEPLRGRPEPRTRERKFRAGGIVGKVLAMLSTATEVADFFDAAYWALPSFVRKACKAEHGIGALARMECVMENPSQIDPETFLKNFLKNQAQDEAFGRFGRLVKGAHEAAHRFTGRDAVHGFQRAHAPPAPQERWHRTADGWRFGL